MAPSSEVGLPACGPGARSSSPSYYPRPRNEAAIRRSASRLYRRRHRENLEREPVDLSQSKKKLRAGRFGISFKFNGRSRSLQRGTVPSINDDPDSVQLIGFRRVKARSHSAEDSSPSRSISSEDSNRDQEELVKEPAVHQNEMERQESFRKLVKDSQEWLRSGINDGEFWTPSEQMGKFFEEAQTKSSEASNEEFAEFIQRNRESFNRCKGNSICMDRGIFSGDRRLLETRASGTKRLVDRDSGIFTEQEVQAGSASSSSTNSSSRSSHAFQRHIRMVKSTSHDAHEQSVHKVSAVHRTESQIKTSGTQPEFKTIIELNGDNNQPPDFQMRPDSLSMASSEPQLRAAILKRPLSEFPTRFTPMSPPNLPNRMSTGFDANMSSSYHFSTSRSRFQYCGETNTFKFSTEHVSSSFSEQGYESVSESEDEESVDVDSASETSSHTERSELGSQSTVSNAPRSESCVTLNAAETQQKTQNALREIAYELLTTERTYVSILRLLNQVYVRVDLENRKAAMFSQDVITGMFANLNSLYKFHNDFVLTKLEERLQSWESNPRIGDLMREWAPFLKMYTEYVKNYDTAMHLIGTWYQKQPRFARIMDEVHSLPECGKLQVSHHMLTPVQRIPRYELLLKEYLKKLPDDSPDREDTEKALELVATAAHHANEAMKKIHKFKKLLEIQELVGGVIDLVSPSRELLKEGKINKISARSGDTQERHLFVFNDLLVLCSQRLISQRVVSGPLYRVRARLEIDGLIVEKGDNLETPNSFYVRNTGRSIELCTLNSDEKLEWMQVLAKAVHDLAQKKSSLKVQRESDECDESPDSSELGLKAPDLVKSDSVSHCMNCATPFSAFGRWKHHCHACGIVACRKCLSQKMRLAYDSSRLLRVCDRCHKLLLQSGQLHSNDENNDENNFKSPPDSPVLPRADKAVMSGYLKLRTNGRSTWSRRWFALQPDFVLYSYKSQEDKLPLTSTPVPGFLVSRLEKGDAVDPKVPHTFKLFHVKKSYYFQANDSDEQEKWINALDQASRAEDLV